MEKKLGVVFAGGGGPGAQALRRLWEALPPGTPGVAADSGLLLAQSAGIKPDWIVGDMDSLGDEKLLLQYPAERIRRHPADKDYSDTELALNLLWENGCGRTWIIGGGGGRTAHVFAIRDIFERERFPQRWITAGEDIRCIDGGDETGREVTGIENGDTVSVFPLGAGPWKAQSRCLKWPLENVKWERGLYGLSNIATGDGAAVNAGQGRFMVILERVCRQN
jgi:thiamine pyrophosphokinase